LRGQFFLIDWGFGGCLGVFLLAMAVVFVLLVGHNNTLSSAAGVISEAMN